MDPWVRVARRAQRNIQKALGVGEEGKKTRAMIKNFREMGLHRTLGYRTFREWQRATL
jgi:hypothetical protein